MRKKTAHRKPGKSAGGPVRIPDCKNFTGYKPCFPGEKCLEKCADPRPYGTKILIVNLEAMGNVLVSTTLLPAIKRKYPASTISWITLGNAARLLENNPYIDNVYIWGPESWLRLVALKFDVVMNIDKSVSSCAFTMAVRSGKKLGYGLNGNGQIIPLNTEARYNYTLGLDDHLKFRINRKTTSQLLTEAMGLQYKRDEYVLRLTQEEEQFCMKARREYGLPASRSRAGGVSPLIVGFNTGCSPLYPNKKMTVEQHLVLVEQLSGREGVRLLLLGGPEDTERNSEIARHAGDKLIGTPTTGGVRRGICYVNLCDVVITGDSFGMHAAIAMKKHVIAWFGLSCPQEIDLFSRGVKLVPEGLECSPCWKRECPFNLECIQMIDLERIVAEVARFQMSINSPRA